MPKSYSLVRSGLDKSTILNSQIFPLILLVPGLMFPHPLYSSAVHPVAWECDELTRIKNNLLKSICFNLTVLVILLLKRIFQFAFLFPQALPLSTVSSKVT